MTRIIAHRGLIDGPDSGLENRIDQISLALSKGYDVEIDVRMDYSWDEKLQRYNPEKRELYLGHDKPKKCLTFKQLESWLNTYPNQHIWIHCKDEESLYYFNTDQYKYPMHFDFFSHDKDPIVMTSSGKFWKYPIKTLSDEVKNTIDVLPETFGPPSSFKSRYVHINYEYDKNVERKIIKLKLLPYGICTDYARLMRKTIEEINQEV